MRKIIVFGSMRSGTTFLANLLNSQAHINLFSEAVHSLFTNALAMGIEDIYQPVTAREVNVLLTNLIAEEQLHNLPTRFNDQIEREQVKTWHDLYESVFQCFVTDPSIQIVGTKTTSLRFYLQQLIAETDTQLIYIYRDPRDVLRSLKNMQAQFDLFFYAERWKAYMDFATQNAHRDNVLVLKYEDLIANKEVVCAQLSEALGVPVNHDLKVLKNRAVGQYQDNSSFGDIKKLFDTTALYRWKKDPATDEVIWANGFLEKELKAYGYEWPGQTDPARYKALLKTYQGQKRREQVRRVAKQVIRKFI